MRFVLLVLVAVVAGCSSVQTRVTGELLVSHSDYDGPPDAYILEVVESHDTTPLAISCIITGIFMGGTCWALLGAPFADQRESALRHAEDVGARIGRCVDIVDLTVEHAGWGAGPRAVTVREMKKGAPTVGGEAAATLCAKAPTAGAH